MHPGRGPGLTSRRLGQRGGVEMVTLTEAQMPNHTHTLRASGAAADEEGTTNPQNNTPGVPEIANRLYGGATNLVSMADQMTQNSGGSQAHNNMQPFLTMNFIIALVGLYPSRS